MVADDAAGTPGAEGFTVPPLVAAGVTVHAERTTMVTIEDVRLMVIRICCCEIRAPRLVALAALHARAWPPMNFPLATLG
jgi:hypothetical protein